MSVKWNPYVLSSLSAYRPDVVVLSGYVHPTAQMAAWWCRRQGIPYGVASETHRRSTHVGGMKWIMKRMITRNLLRGMKFSLPTGRAAGEFLDLIGGVQKPKFFFPNTPDISIYTAASARAARGEGDELCRRFGIAEGRKIILFVGRLIDAKRPLDALRAFQSLGEAASEAVLVFIGDGPLGEQIRSVSYSVANIVCTGWLKDPVDISLLMAKSTALVLPSQHEPWGAVVNEAMAAGTPVLASDHVGAALELVESGRNGFIYQVGDIVALSDKMRQVLFDDVLLLSMAKAAQATALEHGHEFAAANFVDAMRFATGTHTTLSI